MRPNHQMCFVISSSAGMSRNPMKYEMMLLLLSEFLGMDDVVDNLKSTFEVRLAERFQRRF